MPLIDDAMALSLMRRSSSMRLRSVMSTNEHMMQMGSPFSFRTRLAEMSTVKGSPPFPFASISPSHLPLLRTMKMISSTSSCDFANITTGFPITSPGSSVPHIFKAASLT